MPQCWATDFSLCELHAKANAESARANIKPPWQRPWPFTICGATVIAMRALPGAMSSIAMPIAGLAWSSAHIRSAHARASATGSAGAFMRAGR